MVFSAIMALARQSGIPPPGWVLPPVKVRFFICLKVFGCLKKAENIELEELP
jgi:hypothetical protein